MIYLSVCYLILLQCYVGADIFATSSSVKPVLTSILPVFNKSKIDDITQHSKIPISSNVAKVRKTAPTDLKVEQMTRISTNTTTMLPSTKLIKFQTENTLQTTSEFPSMVKQTSIKTSTSFSKTEDSSMKYTDTYQHKNLKIKENKILHNTSTSQSKTPTNKTLKINSNITSNDNSMKSATKAAATSTTTSTTTSTATSTATSSTTSTTTLITTAKPKKPPITYGVEDFPDLDKIQSQRQSSTESSLPLVPEAPNVQASQEFLNPIYHNGFRYVIPIISLMFVVPLIVISFITIYRRVRDCWSTRHYRRMDFLVDGMYND